jgi:hypothetical protein
MVVWQIPQNRTKLAAPVNISEESQETDLSALPVQLETCPLEDFSVKEAVYTFSFAYKSVYDSVYDLLPKVVSK